MITNSVTNTSTSSTVFTSSLTGRSLLRALSSSPPAGDHGRDGATLRRITVFFSPLGRMKSKPARS